MDFKELMMKKGKKEMDPMRKEARMSMLDELKNATSLIMARIRELWEAQSYTHVCSQVYGEGVYLYEKGRQVSFLNNI